jgi:hypothetical protein
MDGRDDIFEDYSGPDNPSGFSTPTSARLREEQKIRLSHAVQNAVRGNAGGLAFQDQADAIEQALRAMHFQARVMG